MYQKEQKKRTKIECHWQLRLKQEALLCYHLGVKIEQLHSEWARLNLKASHFASLFLSKQCLFMLEKGKSVEVQTWSKTHELDSAKSNLGLSGSTSGTVTVILLPGHLWVEQLLEAKARAAIQLKKKLFVPTDKDNHTFDLLVIDRWLKL